MRVEEEREEELVARRKKEKRHRKQLVVIVVNFRVVNVKCGWSVGGEMQMSKKETKAGGV